MDSILPVESIVDKNLLNELSIDLANYFHLNNKEISHLRKGFNVLLDQQMDSKHSKIRNSSNEIHMDIFTLSLSIPTPMPFFQKIVSCYSKGLLDWNAYFQIVVFFSLSPSIALYYYIIIIISHANPKCISWNNILDVTVAFKTQQFTSIAYHDNFIKHDLYNTLFNVIYYRNNDGYLSFHQFLLFVTECRVLFEPLEIFRTKVIETCLTVKICNNILYRLSHLSEIEKYLDDHHNKFPSDPCTYCLEALALNLPPKHRYDYSISSNKMCYAKIVNSYIVLYQPDYRPPIHRRAIKNLRNLSKGRVLLNNVDELYFKMKKDTTTTKGVCMDSSLLSLTLSDDTIVKKFIKQNSSLLPERSDVSCLLNKQNSQTSSILKRQKTTTTTSSIIRNNMEIRGMMLEDELSAKNVMSVNNSDFVTKTKTDSFE